MRLKLNTIVGLVLMLLPFTAMAHGVSSSDQELLNNGGLLSYMYVGAIHMLTGYDHLLFLTGVVFYLNGFKDIVTFITVFNIQRPLPLPYLSYTKEKESSAIPKLPCITNPCIAVRPSVTR